MKIIIRSELVPQIAEEIEGELEGKSEVYLEYFGYPFPKCGKRENGSYWYITGSNLGEYQFKPKVKEVIFDGRRNSFLMGTEFFSTIEILLKGVVVDFETTTPERPLVFDKGNKRIIIQSPNKMIVEGDWSWYFEDEAV